MIKLNDSSVILDEKECDNDLKTITFALNGKYKEKNYALKIDFKNDFNYSVQCIKTLCNLYNSGVSFFTKRDNLKVRYVISNYCDDVITALKAIHISNLRDRYVFIYDSVFDALDKIWKEKNPCDFCDNKCSATRNHKYIDQYDGCCYSFEYTDNFFYPSFIMNKQKCKYLKDDKSCATQNLSCKFFTCSHLQKSKNFSLDMNDFLLLKAFFNKKQMLILKYNFFRSKEEIIDKLLEENNTPFWIYYFKSYYRISDKK